MSCQRIKTHQRLYFDTPMRFSSVRFWKVPRLFLAALCSCMRGALFFWGVWRDMGLGLASFPDPFLLNELFNFWTAKGVCQMIPLSPENLIFIVRYHHIYIYIYNYIVKKEREAVLHAYGCWSRTKFDVFFLISLLLCQVLFSSFGVLVFRVVFLGGFLWLFWFSRREVAISWLMAIRSWRIWKQTLRQGWAA